ncbi:UPAR/Ly6 domain-containing protein CG9338-like [Haematobia irritans]|uniref:UPAR/Ly6 domain-containing protein CG9338-like n=1 Tax=Haematobia irritans TaxID=7368 RepID=UPI003F506A05
MTNFKFLLAFAIIATLAIKAFAIHCYQCGSLGNKHCGEPFMAEDDMKVDCDKEVAPSYIPYKKIGTSFNATGCMIQILESPIGESNQILRSCYFGEMDNTSNGCILDPKRTGLKLGNCIVCTSDYCNLSPSMAPHVAIMTIVFISSFLLS